MSDTKHSPSLPLASLTGDEILPIMTGPSGVLRKTTTQDIADLAAGGIPAAVSNALWTVSVSAGSEDADKIPLTVQVKDLNGNNLAGARNLFISTLFNAGSTFTYTDDGPGSIVQQNFGVSRELIFQTDSTGAAAFSVGTTATGQAAVAFITPQGPVVQLITFA